MATTSPTKTTFAEGTGHDRKSRNTLPQSRKPSREDEEADEIEDDGEKTKIGEDEKKDMQKRSSSGGSFFSTISAGGDGGDKTEKVGWWTTIKRVGKRHVKFVGPGVIASVAYIDAGNVSADFAAGAESGYIQLFFILFATLMALFLQVLAARLGVCSGIDLATHCRLKLHNRKEHRIFFNIILYTLWIIAEIAIMFTDLTELLGGAVAINLMVPQIPLWACVILTSLDVFLILFLFSNYPERAASRSMRYFEGSIAVLVLAVLCSFVALMVQVGPEWPTVFHGYIPSEKLFQNGGMYTAVSIIGSTCMPHGYFLGSKVACVARLTKEDYDEDYNDADSEAKFTATAFSNYSMSGASSTTTSIDNVQKLSTHLKSRRPTFTEMAIIQGYSRIDGVKEEKKEFRRMSVAAGIAVKPLGKGESEETEERPSYKRVVAHLGHATWDIIGSLLGFALTTNSFILITAGAAFFYGSAAANGAGGTADLFSAFDLIRDYIGKPFAYIFAVALLVSGTAASLTVTLAGNAVGEGFVQLNISPWRRRLITRFMGMIPSIIVSVTVGRDGVSTLLVGCQVALSLALPFTIGPLIYFTGNNEIMGVPLTPNEEPSLYRRLSHFIPADSISTLPHGDSTVVQEDKLSIWQTISPFRTIKPREGHATFATKVWISWFAWSLFILINIANVAGIITLATGGA